MQFVCLIYSTPNAGPQPGSPEFGGYLQAYADYTQKVKDDGKFIGGEALQGVETATTVSVRSGKTETIDGPFAETKEQLGGFYILDCADLDEAVKYAAQIPTADHGRIEVRPVMVFD
ncbi:YciI family protein [Pacificoceanicola onchidii]|uniref:YciI family protein n=1 Tax=Pacificoceanicola onchidii TaxID=2562685 RepID=UPI0010A669E0|nr:YciI family protein [Pacificoceanicola onchidii]